MGLSKANNTSFKKGQMPWNKNGKDLICENCQKEFYVPKHRINDAKCCSKICMYEHRKNTGQCKSRTSICIKLAQEGKKIREISEITGYPIGSVSSYLNKAKYRIRVNPGETYGAKLRVLRKIYKECKICGFNRIVEMAHIIPASKGGEITVENMIGLCPNHHHLFDHKKLTNDEAEKLKERVLDWKERIICASKK